MADNKVLVKNLSGNKKRVITITVEELEDGWSAKSVLPAVEGERAWSADDAINFVKGACLVAISYQKDVPDIISFNIEQLVKI
jgi:hypothetical protein